MYFVLRSTRGYSPILDSAPVSALGSWHLAHCRQAGVPCLSSIATLSFNSAPDCAFREPSVVAPSRRHHLAVPPAAGFPLQRHTNLVTSMAFLSMKGPSVPGALAATGPPLIFLPLLKRFVPFPGSVDRKRPATGNRPGQST